MFYTEIEVFVVGSTKRGVPNEVCCCSFRKNLSELVLQYNLTNEA